MASLKSGTGVQPVRHLGDECGPMSWRDRQANVSDHGDLLDAQRQSVTAHRHGGGLASISARGCTTMKHRPGSAGKRRAPGRGAIPMLAHRAPRPFHTRALPRARIARQTKRRSAGGGASEKIAGGGGDRGGRFHSENHIKKAGSKSPENARAAPGAAVRLPRIGRRVENL